MKLTEAEKVGRRIRWIIREACKSCDELTCRGCRFPRMAKEVRLKLKPRSSY